MPEVRHPWRDIARIGFGMGPGGRSYGGPHTVRGQPRPVANRNWGPAYGRRPGGGGRGRFSRPGYGVSPPSVGYGRGRRVGSYGKSQSRRACLLGTHPEKKFLDIVVSEDMFTGGNTLSLAEIPQGITESSRVGRKVIVTDIMFKGHITNPEAAAGLTNNELRVLVIQDTQTNKVAFPQAKYNFAAVRGYRDLSSAQRFKTLHDKNYVVNHSAAMGDDVSVDKMKTWIGVKFSIKCCVEIEYDTSLTTGVLSTQTVNSLTLLLYRDTAVVQPELNGTLRIRFVE